MRINGERTRNAATQHILDHEIQRPQPGQFVAAHWPGRQMAIGRQNALRRHPRPEWRAIGLACRGRAAAPAHGAAGRAGARAAGPDPAAGAGQLRPARPVVRHGDDAAGDESCRAGRRVPGRPAAAGIWPRRRVARRRDAGLVLADRLLPGDWQHDRAVGRDFGGAAGPGRGAGRHSTAARDGLADGGRTGRRDRRAAWPRGDGGGADRAWATRRRAGLDARSDACPDIDVAGAGSDRGRMARVGPDGGWRGARVGIRRTDRLQSAGTPDVAAWRAACAVPPPHRLARTRRGPGCFDTGTPCVLDRVGGDAVHRPI